MFLYSYCIRFGRCCTVYNVHICTANRSGSNSNPHKRAKKWSFCQNPFLCTSQINYLIFCDGSKCRNNKPNHLKTLICVYALHILTTRYSSTVWILVMRGFSTLFLRFSLDISYHHYIYFVYNSRIVCMYCTLLVSVTHSSLSKALALEQSVYNTPLEKPACNTDTCTH